MAHGSDLVRKLLGLHGEGRLAEMEKLARKALRDDPNSPLLNELLGTALTGQGRPADALPFLASAVRRKSDDAQFWENLGLCQFQLKQHGQAPTACGARLR